MYLFLNLSFTTKDNLLDIGILLSLLIPLGSLVMKISSFVEYTSTYETNQARRDSWIQHHLIMVVDLYETNNYIYISLYHP